MKIAYLRLSAKGMQCAAGRLRQDLTAEYGYEMTLVSNLRAIKVDRPEWAEPIFVPLERLENFRPAPGELVKKVSTKE